jgi:uncharacterized protein YjbJ (UPF0337 family)
MMTQTPQPFSTSGTDEPTSTGSESDTSARESAGQVANTAMDQAAGVAREAKYQARDLAGEARDQIRQQADVQRGRLSDLLQDLSDDLDQMADRSDRSGLASDLARQAAMRARDARAYLDSRGDVLQDVRQFARSKPGTFLIGALAAGVLAGRATRASAAARRQPQTDARSGAGGYPATASTTFPAPVSGSAPGEPTGSRLGDVSPPQELPQDREERR